MRCCRQSLIEEQDVFVVVARTAAAAAVAATRVRAIVDIVTPTLRRRGSRREDSEYPVEHCDVERRQAETTLDGLREASCPSFLEHWLTFLGNKGSRMRSCRIRQTKNIWTWCEVGTCGTLDDQLGCCIGVLGRLSGRYASDLGDPCSMFQVPLLAFVTEWMRVMSSRAGCVRSL